MLSASCRLFAKRSSLLASVFDDFIVRQPQTNLSYLQNGMRVTTEEHPTSPIATIGLFLKGGAAFDLRHIRGNAKVLEQCMLQGGGGMNRTEFTQALRDIGAQVWSKTGRERSYLYMRCHKSNVPRAVSLLGAMFTMSVLDKTIVANAASEVQKASQKAKEDLETLAMDTLFMNGYKYGGPYHRTLGNPLFGEHLCLNDVSAATLKAYRETLVGPRLVLAGVGGISQLQLEKLGNEFFGSLPRQGGVKEDKDLMDEVIFTPGITTKWLPEAETVHVAWATEVCSALSGESVPLSIAAQLANSSLEHPPRSSAWNRLRELFGFPAKQPKYNVCEGIKFVRTFFNQYEETGLMGQYCIGYPTPLFRRSWGDLMRQWKEIAEGIEPEALDEAKTNVKLQLVLNRDGDSNILEDIGKQTLVYGRRLTLTEMFDRIDHCDHRLVKRVFRHYFKKQPHVTLCGCPFELGQ